LYPSLQSTFTLLLTRVFFLFWFAPLPCSPVCSASAKDHSELLVRCDQCIPRRSMYRCVGCYQLFADAISARTLQLSEKTSKKVSFRLHDKRVFQALLGAPWENLAEASSIDEATRLLIVPVAGSSSRSFTS
jgi:hypothetical protein